MLKKFTNSKTQENNLYSNILLLSRNTLFYTKFNLSDTFQNRIHLIFIHISFLFIKIKHNNQKNVYKLFYQKMFDFIFHKIEQNMREIGYGDTVINKNMKFLVRVFYDILLNCEKYNKKTVNSKNIFLTKYLKLNIKAKSTDYGDLFKYFDKYQAFCFDLRPDSVLKGELKFFYELNK